jgi:hypothetical protein
MKRIAKVLAVTALMVAMLVASAMPAFAQPANYGHCHKIISQEGHPSLPSSHSEFNELAQPAKSQGNQGDAPFACRVFF